MSPTPPPPPPGFSRRTLLGASAAGLALLVAGCSSPPADEREQVTSKQADELAAQVAVQETLVAAYSAAGTADPALAAEIGELASQAGVQLTRLKAAAPGSSSRTVVGRGRTPVGGRGAGVAARPGRRRSRLACHGQRGPVGGPGSVAGIDRRGPARPGRETGVTRDG